MSRGHILIVDDEESIRRSLEGILTDEGYTISQAADGGEALEVVKREDPDVVLLDVWLPGLNGIQALQAVRKQRAGLEVIMMSGHANIETAVKATKLGAFDFVEKPLSLDQVVRTVELALRQQRLLRENAEFQGYLAQASELIGRSQALLKLRQEIESAASREGPVLIYGEVGSGKELVARLIQARRSGIVHPLIRVKGGQEEESAIENSLARRLFGHQGPSGEVQTGQLEAAENGMVYLYAAEQMAPEVASRLAAALKKGRFQREGGRRSLPLKVEIFFSTTFDLRRTPIEEVLGKELTEQIQGEPVQVPPLRERWEDVRSLVEHFLSQFCSHRGLRRPVLEEAAIEALEKYAWPQNIKELKNVVESLVLSERDDVIALANLPERIQGVSEEEPKGRPRTQVREKTEWEKDYLAQLLRKHGGNLRRTASQLGISEGQLRSKIKAHGLKISQPKKGKGAVQRTLGKSVLLSGQGLHSGLKTGLILSPLPPDSGIRVGNITTEESVLAHLDNVVSTDSAVTLEQGPIRVRTIEHLMAALHAYGITNVLIKVGDEIPIMDGSARDFCQLIEDGGVVEQNARVEPVEVASPIEVARERVTLRIEPHPEFVADFTLALPDPIGVQEFRFTLDGHESFREAIAPARTFGRIKDVEEQEKRGLVGGGRLDNVILLDEGRVINTELRFPDEFVRHKILDVIGDLYLLGRPIRGKVTARMSGHAENVQLLRRLRAQ